MDVVWDGMLYWYFCNRRLKLCDSVYLLFLSLYWVVLLILTHSFSLYPDLASLYVGNFTCCFQIFIYDTNSSISITILGMRSLFGFDVHEFYILYFDALNAMLLSALCLLKLSIASPIFPLNWRAKSNILVNFYTWSNVASMLDIFYKTLLWEILST